MAHDNLQLAGIHHLTAITAHAARNLAFYTQTLGLRLVKKTVNQDDVSAYHLFYADGRATPGTDITFFDWPAAPERRGTRSIVRTGFRIATESSLHWWAERFAQLGVKHDTIVTRDGHATIDFEDPEGQRLSLVHDETRTEAHPWDRSPIPAEHQIRGLGPITISVPGLDRTERVLTSVMNMRCVREYAFAAGVTAYVFEMDEGGAAAELHALVEPEAASASQGAGGVHHVAFRVRTFEEYDAWAERLDSLGIRSSGPIDRYYFRSLYFREPNGILFELATDGPGFATDEALESLGEKLSLPPFLETRRREIEGRLKPIT